jgi:hypothetical protein
MEQQKPTEQPKQADVLNNKITTTTAFEYELDGCSLKFSLTTDKQKNDFITIMTQAMIDVKNSIGK